MQVQPQQIFLREDIIQFNHQLNQSTHNVKRFRTKSNQKYLQSNDNHSFSQDASLIISSLRCRNIDKRKLESSKNNRIINKNQSSQRTGVVLNDSSRIKTKRISVTSQMKRNTPGSKINYQSQSTMRIQSTAAGVFTTRQQPKIAKMSLVQQTSNINIPQFCNFLVTNKCQEIQKLYNKSNITNKNIENWLNHILIEYCLEQKFDLTIQNGAVKKFSLDQISLMSLGIKRKDVNRLHRSLFVYSIGFNNLLKQMTNNNMDLMKTLWKVYAILLEFCAEGNFESMIADIERDKAKKIDKMKQQIQKRQIIIENSDQAYKQKNAKIQKQLRDLKQKNQTLVNQKEVLLEDYKRAQQAFNQQVAVRLKFQNKINEIHGIYKQLSIKHARLYDDYRLQILYSKQKEAQLNQQKQQIFNLKFDLQNTNKELQKCKNDCMQKEKFVEQVNQDKAKLNKIIFQLKYDKQYLNGTIDQKDRLISQFKIQKDMLEAQIKMKCSSNNQTNLQFQVSLLNIQKLHQNSKQQLQKISELMHENKQLKRSTFENVIKYQTQMSKVKQKNDEINILQEKNMALKYKIDMHSSQLQTAQQMNKMLQGSIILYRENIQKMKQIKNRLEDQLQFAQKRSKMLYQLITQKQEKLLSQAEKIQELSQQIDNINVQIRIIKSRNQLLEEKLTSEIQISTRKIDKLTKQNIQYKKTAQNCIKQLQECKKQLQKHRQLYRESNQNLKNEKFQRINLDIVYKQSLQVVQSQNQHISELNRKISQLVQQVEDKNRKIRNIQFISDNKLLELNKQTQRTRERINVLLNQKGLYRTFIHPMIFQDMQSNYNRQHLQMESIINKHKQRQNQQIQIINSLKKYNKQLQNRIQLMSNQYEEDIKIKNQQLEYGLQKIKHLNQKLQLRQNQEKEKKLTNDRTDMNEKQFKYLSTIKQKTKQIETLVKQLQQIQDQNTLLKAQLTKIKDQIRDKDINYQQLNHQIESLLKQNQSLQQQIKRLSQQKSQYQLKIENKQKSNSLKPQSSNHQRALSRQSHQQLLAVKSKKSEFNSLQIKQQIIQNKSKQKPKRKQMQKKIKNATMYYLH